jgi:hypothetical protein
MPTTHPFQEIRYYFGKGQSYTTFEALCRRCSSKIAPQQCKECFGCGRMLVVCLGCSAPDESGNIELSTWSRLLTLFKSHTKLKIDWNEKVDCNECDGLKASWFSCGFCKGKGRTTSPCRCGSYLGELGNGIHTKEPTERFT